MAQPTKCLFCKQENQSLIPRTHIRETNRECETDKWIPALTSQFQQATL